VGISATIIGLVAFSRVYLGVHWMSDAVGALVLGALYLLGVEWLLDWHHRRHSVRLLLARASASSSRVSIRPGRLFDEFGKL